MTRTERATSPHAIIKDRSQSRTGIDRHTPKGGAGPHNWGSLLQERDLEEGALYDEEREFEASAGGELSFRQSTIVPNRKLVANETEVPTREHRSSSVSVTEEDRERALQFRKNALKSGGQSTIRHTIQTVLRTDRCTSRCRSLRYRTHFGRCLCVSS